MPKLLLPTAGVPVLPRLWAMEPTRFASLLSEKFGAGFDTAIKVYWDSYDEVDEEPKKPYTIKNGVARLDLKGPLVKEADFWTWWFGGTSLEAFSHALRCAVADEEVDEILLVVDSPGGTLDGTPSAGNAVLEAKSAKPVRAHIDGCGCSAAYWIASQVGPGNLTSNPESDVANIGVYMTVTDISEMLSTEGIDVHLYATGKYKGAGTRGVKITAAHDEQFQDMVEAPFTLFQTAVQSARNLSNSQLKTVREGKVYMAADAIALGLIDRVGYLNDGVPPGAEVPTTTDDGEPPEEPSEDNEEKASMNEEQQKQKSFFDHVAGWFSKQGGQEPAAPPKPTGSTTETPPPVPPPSVPPVGESAELTTLRVAFETQQATIVNLQAQMNALKIEEYVQAGKITPAQRAAQTVLRLANPDVYDTAMAGVAVHPAFSTTGQATADSDTVPAEEVLKQLQAGGAPYASLVEENRKRQEADAKNGNALTRIKTGGR